MSQRETLYYVGFCKRCGTGPLGVRICGPCGRPWIVCDECDAVWDNPSCDGEPLTLAEPELPCPACQASLMAPTSRWASEEDLDRVGWHEYVVGKGTAFGTDGEAESGAEQP